MTDQRTYERRWWTLAVLCLSLVVISLDNTILNVALPTLVRDLGATASQLQWIVDAYVLVFAGLLLTAGSLGDRFGRKKALLSGLALFGVFSVLAAMSGTANHLILTRALMGVGGAAIMPTTLSILTNVFPDEERAKAIGVWAAVSGIAIPLGPVVGGWLLEHYFWGSVFLVNIPVVAVALVAGWFLVPESRDPKALPLDPVGAVLSIAGLSALLYGIIEAPAKGWSNPGTLIAVALGLGILGLFVAWERRQTAPMFDMRLFKNPRFSAASLSVTLVFFAMFGATFFLSQYLQLSLGYTTLQAGVRYLPIAIGVGVGAPLSARLTGRFGTKLVVSGGMLVVALGFGIMSTATTSSGYALVASSMFVLSLGMGLAMTPATDAVMGAVPKDNAGVGSAVNDTTRQVGGALGVAILGSVLSTVYGSSMRDVTASLPAEAAGPARDSIGGAFEVARQLGAAGQALIEQANQAFVHAMTTTLLIGAMVAVLGALVAFFFLPSQAAEAEPVVETTPTGELVPEPVRVD